MCFLMLGCSESPLGSHMRWQQLLSQQLASCLLAALPVGPSLANQALWYLPVAEPLDVSQGALSLLSPEFYFLAPRVNANALHGIMFIKFRCVVTDIDHSGSLWQHGTISRYFAEAELGVDSHLILIKTNHREIRYYVKFQSFWLLEFGLAGLLTSYLILLFC